MEPEFLREGLAVQDTMAPDRIVYGLPEDRERGEIGRAALDRVDAPILERGTPRLVVNYPTAELVKVAANSFLATKISFINSMAELCDATGGDVARLAEAIGHDERIGRKFLRAGIGFGGGCLPKDIRAFMARAGELGVDQSLTFLREVDSINLRRRDHAVDVAAEMAGGRLVGVKVAVLGLTFKPDSDDVRDSPALDIAGRLWGAAPPSSPPTPPAPCRSGRSRPTCTSSTPPRRPSTGPTSSCCSPSGPSTSPSTPPVPARSCAPRASSTGATPSTRGPGPTPAGTTGEWGAPPRRGDGRKCAGPRVTPSACG